MSDATTISVLPTPMTRNQTATLVGRTMGYVAATVGAFALGAYFGRNASTGLGWLLLIAAIASLVAINKVAQRSPGLAAAILLGFGMFLGLSLAPTLSYYARTNPAILWQSGGATSLLVAAFGAAGYATRRDLSALARWLFWALVALIVFSVVLIFVQIPHGSVIYAVVGLVIFAGLIAYDFQRLRRTKDIRDAPLLAASIFLDLLNVFLLVLGLFSGDTN